MTTGVAAEANFGRKRTIRGTEAGLGNMALERELQTYHKHLESLLAHQGKYVVISGEDIIGIFVAYEDALRTGYEKVGVKPFLVKKIEATENIQYFSRDIGLCPT